MSDKFKFEVTFSTNVDHYCNVGRQFRFDNAEGEHLVLSSGSSGVALAVKGHNNGFIHLDAALVKALVKELKKVVQFSEDARSDAANYWEAKNSSYLEANNIKKKHE
jgi:hypothetical protein